MSAHTCRQCVGWKASIWEMEGEIRNLLRIAERRPGTGSAINGRARIAVLKERIRSNRDILTRHLAEIGADA